MHPCLQQQCINFTTIMHQLCNNYASTLQQLFINFATIMHQLCYYYASTLQQLCINFATVIHQLCNNYASTLQQLCLHFHNHITSQHHLYPSMPKPNLNSNQLSLAFILPLYHPHVYVWVHQNKIVPEGNPPILNLIPNQPSSAMVSFETTPKGLNLIIIQISYVHLTRRMNLQLNVFVFLATRASRVSWAMS